MIIKFFLLILVSSLSFAKTSDPIFDSYFNQVFSPQKISLAEATKFKTLVNSKISTLTEKTYKENIYQSVQLIMLLTEIESQFPKDKTFSDTQSLLARVLQFPRGPQNAQAEDDYYHKLLAKLGPLKTNDILEKYKSTLIKMKRIDQIANVTNSQCSLYSDLFLTAKFEKCMAELKTLIPATEQALLLTHSFAFLQHYYYASPNYTNKAQVIKNEVIKSDIVKRVNSLLQLLNLSHDLLSMKWNEPKIKEALQSTDKILALNLPENFARLKLRYSKIKSVLLLKQGLYPQAKTEIDAVSKLYSRLPEGYDSNYINNLLFKMYIQYKLKTFVPESIVLVQRDFSVKPKVCTTGLSFDLSLVAFMKLAGFNQNISKNLSQTLSDCKKYVGLPGQDSVAFNMLTLAELLNKEKIDPKMKPVIIEKYNLLKNDLHLVGHLDLFLDEVITKL